MKKIFESRNRDTVTQTLQIESYEDIPSKDFINKRNN